MEPIIKATVQIFGADRCLYGSNFPIEKLWTDYATLYRTFRHSLKHLSESEQGAISLRHCVAALPYLRHY